MGVALFRWQEFGDARREGAGSAHAQVGEDMSSSLHILPCRSHASDRLRGQHRTPPLLAMLFTHKVCVVQFARLRMLLPLPNPARTHPGPATPAMQRQGHHRACGVCSGLSQVSPHQGVTHSRLSLEQAAVPDTVCSGSL